MYRFYLDGDCLPVTPGKMQTQINNQNSTMTMINEGEINILKTPKLSNFQFEFMLPHVNYPFCQPTYAGLIGGVFPQLNSLLNLGAIGAIFPSQKSWLKKLAYLKESKKPFQFMVQRLRSGSTLKNVVVSESGNISYEHFTTNVKVSLEDYSIKEDSDEMGDVWVDVKLKVYRPYGVKKYSMETKDGKSVAVPLFERDTSTSIDGIDYGEVSNEERMKNMFKTFMM